MTVRRATVDDAVGIARVHTLSWQVAYRGVVPDSVLDGLDVESRAAGWRRNVTSGGVFVAVVDESVADNPRARRFYERHGFVLDGVTRVETMGGKELAEVRYARRAS